MRVFPAIAAENDRRLRRSRTATAGSSARSGRRGTGTTGTRGAGTTESRGDATRAAKRQASDIALAHRSVPVWLDLTGLWVGCDAIEDAVVDEDVGIGNTADRAVLVVD